MASSTSAPPKAESYPDVQAEASRAGREGEGGRWVDEGMRRGRDLYAQAGRGADWMSEQFGEVAEQRPLAALGAGLVAGFALGFLIGLLVWDGD